MALPRSTGLLLRRPTRTVYDLGNARLRDNFIALKRQYRHLAPIALAGPKEHRVRDWVHVHHNRPLITLGERADVNSLAPAVVHRERHYLLVDRQERRVTGLGCARLFDLVVGVASDLLLGLGLLSASANYFSS